MYDHPANVFVAAFIGSPSMNLVEGQLSGTSLTIGSHQLELPQTVYDRRPRLGDFDGHSVIVGIRPEDLEDAALVADTATTSRLRGAVTLTEALGSEVVVHFGLDAPRVDAGDPDAVDDLGDQTAVGRFSPRTRVRMGDQIDIAVAVENLHFFDPTARTNLAA